MPTITKLSALSLTFALSFSLTLAQQSVRRIAPKTAVRPKTAAVTRSTSTPARRPVTAATSTPKTQSVAPAATPVATAGVARQAEPQQQSVSRPAPVHRNFSTARHNRTVYLNAGVGLATYYGGGFPVGVSVEVEAKNNFSVGGSIDYYHYKYGYYSGGSNFVYAGARGSYHFPTQSSNFDPYIGATLGFRYAGNSTSGYSYYDNYGYNSGLYVGVHLGARCYFSPKIGAFAEVGYGVSAVKLGITAKL